MMRVLFVSKHFPEDLSTKVHGVFKRFRMFVDAIKDIAEIDLLYYVPHGTDTSPSSVLQFERTFSVYYETPIRLFLCKMSDQRNLPAKLQRYAFGIFNFLHHPICSGINGARQLQAFEACLERNPNAIFVHRLGAICPIFKTHWTLPPIFFDLDDIEDIAFKRRIRNLPNISKKLLNTLLIPALSWGQNHAVRIAYRTFVCSDVDRHYLKRHQPHPLEKIVVIPNAVEVPKPKAPADVSTLLFLGSFNHQPNVDAAEFLIREIWPLIQQAVPAATLIIAGSPAEKIPSYREGRAGIRFMGFVEDLDALYRHSLVVCAPILSGSGTRVKIIEAGAYCRPIVSTQIGAEGIAMKDGSEILLCDDPKSFAKACTLLLTDRQLCAQIGRAAHLAVTKNYDLINIKRIIQEIFKESFSNMGSLKNNNAIKRVMLPHI